MIKGHDVCNEYRHYFCLQVWAEPLGVLKVKFHQMVYFLLQFKATANAQLPHHDVLKLSQGPSCTAVLSLSPRLTRKSKNATVTDAGQHDACF